MVRTAVYWNLASSAHPSSSTSFVHYPVTVITGGPYSTFSPSASELLRIRPLAQWLSFIREVGFYEDGHNPFQSLKDNKARIQQFEVHAIDARLRSWSSTFNNHCLNTHECYSVSCKPCMVRYLDEHAAQAGIDDLKDPATIKDISKRPNNTDLGISNNLYAKLLLEAEYDI
jgi:hypothetical protein